VGKHSAITQDTDIAERRLNRCEHIANCGFGLVHRVRPSNLFHGGRGAGEGTGPATQLVWVSRCTKITEFQKQKRLTQLNRGQPWSGKPVA
jgi:hypothetical protein